MYYLNIIIYSTSICKPKLWDDVIDYEDNVRTLNQNWSKLKMKLIVFNETVTVIKSTFSISFYCQNKVII